MTIQRELDERRSKCVGLYGQFLFSCSESFLQKVLYIIEKHCFLLAGSNTELLQNIERKELEMKILHGTFHFIKLF